MKLHDKLVNLLDVKDGITVSFKKYNFTTARRKAISEILGVALNRMPKSIVVAGKDSLGTAYVKAVEKKGYRFDNTKDFEVDSSIKKGMKHVEITESQLSLNFKSRVDWIPGTFGTGTNGHDDLGESNSCFFGSKAGAVKMIMNSGGNAVTVYMDGAPFARFFILPISENEMIVFNIYVKDQAIFGLEFSETLELLAKTIAAHCDDSFDVKRARFTNMGSSSGRLHINNEMGYVIGKKPLPDRVDTNIELADFYKCTSCGGTIYNDDDVVRDGNDRPWCEECAEENLEICNYDLLMYGRHLMIVGPDGLNYYNENIEKVNKFVFDSDAQKYIFKSDAKELKPGVWVNKDSDKGVCRICGRVSKLSKNGLCPDCMDDEEYLEMFDDFGVNLFNMTWNFPTDNSKAEKFLKAFKERINA